MPTKLTHSTACYQRNLPVQALIQALLRINARRLERGQLELNLRAVDQPTGEK